MAKFSDYFNSITDRGRANVAKATYASIAVLYLYSRYKRSKNKQPLETVNDKIGDNIQQKTQINCPPCDNASANKIFNDSQSEAPKQGPTHLQELNLQENNKISVADTTSEICESDQNAITTLASSTNERNAIDMDLLW